MGRRFIAVTLIAIVALLIGRVDATAQPRDEKPPAYLLEVDQFARGAIDEKLATRRAAIVAKMDAAPTETARRIHQRDLDKVDEEIDRTRSWTLDGWARHAQRNGEPIGSRFAKQAFFIPGNARNQRELKNLRRGDQIAIDGRSARDLFVNAGRRYAQARTVRRMEPARPPRTGKRDPMLPTKPDPDGATGAAVTFLQPVAKAPRANNPNTTYRGAIRVKANAPEGAPPVLQLWAHVYVGYANGDVVGPMPYYFDFKRRGEGEANVSVSFEIVQLEGAPAIDEKQIRFEIIATQWGEREAY